MAGEERAGKVEAVMEPPRAQGEELGDGAWGNAWLVRACNRWCAPRAAVAPEAAARGGPPRLLPWSGDAERRGWIVLLYSAAALGAVVLVIWLDWSEGTELGVPRLVSCRETFRPSAASCGWEGVACRPFESEWAPARCDHLCNADADLGVFGSGPYRGDSQICAAAVHAGVISRHWGGCFKYRLVGERGAFRGSTARGIASRDAAWHPAAVEVAAVASSFSCMAARPGTDAAAFLAFVGLLLLARPSGLQALFFMVAEGFLKLSSAWRFYRDASVLLVESLNWQAPTLLFVLLPTTYVVYLHSARSTLPDVSRYPLDATLFYWLPFWAGVRLDMVKELGVDLSFSHDAVEGSAVWGALLMSATGLPAALAMARSYQRAGQLGAVARRAAAAAAATAALSLALASTFSLHLHHYLVGLAGAFFFRGQTRSRVFIVAQALMLGVWVNGVVVWGTDALLDAAAPSLAAPPPDAGAGDAPVPARAPFLLWSRAELLPEGGVEAELVPEHVALGDWGCGPALSGAKWWTNAGAPSGGATRRRLDVLATPAPTSPQLPQAALFLNGFLVGLAPLASDGTIALRRTGLSPDGSFFLYAEYLGATSWLLPVHFHAGAQSIDLALTLARSSDSSGGSSGSSSSNNDNDGDMRCARVRALQDWLSAWAKNNTLPRM
jgi:hypothetical protein